MTLPTKIMLFFYINELILKIDLLVVFFNYLSIDLGDWLMEFETLNFQLYRYKI